MKSQVIEQILPLLRLPTHEQSKMRTELETHSLVELKAFLGVVSSPDYQAELAEEEILRVQAERAADRVLFQIQHQKATEPERKLAAAAQLAQDRKTFAEAAKTIQQFAMNEANFNVIRQTLGEGFTVYAIREMLAANAAILSPPTQQELDQWESERVEAHNEALQRMDPGQLRARVRQEAADARVQQAQAETDRQLDALRTKDAPFGYQPLPTEFTKEKLLQMVKNETEKYRFIVKKFGNHNITVRLQGRG